MGVRYADAVFQSMSEQRRDVDPPWIISHLGGTVELEGLVLDVEAQAREGFSSPWENAADRPREIL
jgi:hypothetical protein